MQLRDDQLRLEPHLPRDLDVMSMEFHYRGHTGTLTFHQDRLTVTLRESELPPMAVAVGEHTKVVEAGQTVELTFPPDQVHRPVRRGRSAEQALPRA